jgi:hypothetical protein
LALLLKWNNAALVSQYHLNLKDTIKRELARRDPIHDLEDLIAVTIDIDNRLPDDTNKNIIFLKTTAITKLVIINNHNHLLVPLLPLVPLLWILLLWIFPTLTR